MLTDPANKIITAVESEGIVKGIELKPEQNNKVVGEIAVIPSTSSTPSRCNKLIF